MFVQRLRLREHFHLASPQIIPDTPTTKTTSRRFYLPNTGPTKSSTTQQHTTITFDVITIFKHSASGGTTRFTQDYRR